MQKNSFLLKNGIKAQNPQESWLGRRKTKLAKACSQGDFRDWIRVQNNIPMEHNFLYKQTMVLTATSFA